uniref:NADH-ubiquinone oxidoreductase chain 2 n=1 Tax=Curculionidae sp. BMNH 1274272 TaxID=1796500 RepID=A0A126TF51_9CUCU|nr:NADH dehydrogenase subunit 2 [Curculionidae sp. BMNH 1274272]
MMNFYKFIFFSLLVTSSLISISSMSWFMAWFGLEMNLLSIIPLMKSMNKYFAEATIKYFIIQAMASTLLLFSIIIFSTTKTTSLEFLNKSSICLNSALLLKMGAAPFHFWLPEILSGLNWKMIFIIMSWQKIAPMILLMYTSMLSLYLTIITILSSLISGIQGLNQTCLRKIMAYSSINHMSWMISTILNSMTTWIYYFLIYCIINLNIIVILNKFHIYYFNQLNKLFSFNKNLLYLFMLNFISLGGLPPFLGFLPKWLAIFILIQNNYIFMTTLLILTTLISLYFYLRITFSTFILSSKNSLTNSFKIYNFLTFWTNSITLTSLIICTFTINMF